MFISVLLELYMVHDLFYLVSAIQYFFGLS